MHIYSKLISLKTAKQIYRHKSMLASTNSRLTMKHAARKIHKNKMFKHTLHALSKSKSTKKANSQYFILVITYWHAFSIHRLRFGSKTDVPRREERMLKWRLPLQATTVRTLPRIKQRNYLNLSPRVDSPASREQNQSTVSAATRAVRLSGTSGCRTRPQPTEQCSNIRHRRQIGTRGLVIT